MTNYWEELDKQHFQLRDMSLKQWAAGNYMKAADMLYTRNLAAPPDAFLEDMRPFSYNQNSSRSKITVQQQAMNYCRKWLPLIEGAMNITRHKNLQAMKRL